MNKTIKILSKFSILAIAMMTCAAFSATTARPTIATTTTRTKLAGGASAPRTSATVTPNKTSATPTVTTTEPEPIIEPEPEPVIVVDNKTSQFDEILSDIAGIAPDTSSDDLARRVREQRALLDATDIKTVGKSSEVTGANACDMGLRKCMSEKCGKDFTKCANDSTTIWGDKMDSCRRTTKCTGHEYTLLAPEILADRDMNVRMAYYNSVLNCGNKYNSCIFGECGTHLDKCLSKSAGDRAISKCESIARECREQDSGLSARVMSAFGDLRTVATKTVQKQEQRLYELRDLMRAQCNRLGAMFDERTLDCVYTVNFFAGDDTETPKASKKLYAGDSFQCNANWFGIDITTFKENAYRLTRSQAGASAAALGAGVGTAAGLISSGAVSRAIDTQKAKKAADAATVADECVKAGGTYENGKCKENKDAIDTSTNPTPNKDDGSNTSSNGGGTTYTIGADCMRPDGATGKWKQQENGSDTCSDNNSDSPLKCSCEEEINGTSLNIPDRKQMPEFKNNTKNIITERVVGKPCTYEDLQEWHANQGHYIVNTDSKNAVECLNNNNNKKTKCTCAATECDDGYDLMKGAWCKKNSQTNKKTDISSDSKKKVNDSLKESVSPGGDDKSKPETTKAPEATATNNINLATTDTKTAKLDTNSLRSDMPKITKTVAKSNTANSCSDWCTRAYSLNGNKLIYNEIADENNCHDTCRSYAEKLCNNTLEQTVTIDGQQCQVKNVRLTKQKNIFVCSQYTPDCKSQQSNDKKDDKNNPIVTKNAVSNCDTVCAELGALLTKDNTSVLLTDNSCEKTCTTTLTRKCNELSGKLYHRGSPAKYECAINSPTPKKKESDATATATKNEVKKETKDSATTTSNTSQPQTNNNQNATNTHTITQSNTCNLNNMIANMKLDTPIEISGCSASQKQNIITALRETCINKFPTLYVLQKDRKTAKEQLREPVYNDNQFTCTKTMGTTTYPTPNSSAKAIASKWRVQNNSDATSCASECNALAQNITLNQPNNFNRPECLQQCASVAQTACEQKFGNNIFAIYQLYSMDKSLHYWCSRYDY